MIDWPLDSNVIRRNSDNNTYGPVRMNSAGNVQPHQGWDFFAEVGTPCYAIADGKVALIYVSKDYGNVLVASFTHEGQTLYAAYAHMGKITVNQGAALKRGDKVGLTGESGNARGMRGPDQHLHFEIRTEPRPGMGLAGRMSPMRVFGICPLHTAIKRTAL